MVLVMQVLTIEWVEGARLVDKELLGQYQADPTKLVDTLVQCSLKQMLEVGRPVTYSHTTRPAAAAWSFLVGLLLHGPVLTPPRLCGGGSMNE